MWDNFLNTSFGCTVSASSVYASYLQCAAIAWGMCLPAVSDSDIRCPCALWGTMLGIVPCKQSRDELKWFWKVCLLYLHLLLSYSIKWVLRKSGIYQFTESKQLHSQKLQLAKPSSFYSLMQDNDSWPLSQPLCAPV